MHSRAAATTAIKTSEERPGPLSPRTCHHITSRDTTSWSRPSIFSPSHLSLGELPPYQGLVLDEVLGALPGGHALAETRLELPLRPPAPVEQSVVLFQGDAVRVAVPGDGDVRASSYAREEKGAESEDLCSRNNRRPNEVPLRWS